MYYKTQSGTRATILSYGPGYDVDHYDAEGLLEEGKFPTISVSYVMYDLDGNREESSVDIDFDRVEDRDACLRQMDRGEIRVVDPATVFGAVS